MAELDRTVQADKATVDAKISELARLAQQVQTLTALRDQLTDQVKTAAAANMTEQQKRQAAEALLEDEQKLGDSSRAKIATLTQEIEQLKREIGVSNQRRADEAAKASDLEGQLNLALAAQVEELRKYRSDFFGKLRDVLAGRPGIAIVGDRFVFQSEVLFPVGSADLTQAGVAQMTALAVTIKDIATEIPDDLHWVLRVDGHTDPQPVKGLVQFPSNWELSAARAITVVKLLIADGVPADHLAAAAFGEYQPIVPGDSPEDYAKDRRIELRLTDR
jgi:chemotaxis protein MotB